MKPTTLQPAQKKAPAARVNGAVISQFQVESGLQSLLEPYRDVKGKLRMSQEQQYAARKHVIENLINRELLFQEASRKGFAATPEELSQYLNACKREYETQAQFKASLAAQGLSLDEYRRQLQHDITINKFAASLVEGKRKPVTTQEARAYYEDHPGEMVGSEMRRVLQMTAPLDRYATRAEEHKARLLLERIRGNAREFNKIIADGGRSGTDLKGEDLGFVARGQMHPLLDAVVCRLPAGQISRAVRTEEGLHLLKVVAVLEADKMRPFDMIEDELKKKLYEMRSTALLTGCIEKLRQKASIEILDRIADSKLNLE